MTINGKERSVLVGHVFADLAKHLFGGYLTERNPSVGNSREVGKIDVTDFDRNRMLEIKASNSRDRFVMLERQYNLYKRLNKGDFGQLNLFLGYFEIYYAFFSYKPNKNLYDYSDLLLLKSDLHNGLESILILSFDIIEKMFSLYPMHKNTTWPNNIQFKRKDVKTFFTDPTKALLSLNLDDWNYEVQEVRLSNGSPKGKGILGVSVVNRDYINGQFF